jgi:hypothetical protein
MSKKLFFLPVLMLLAIAVMTPSCGDKCEKKECANGQCDDVDGTCLCDAGYEYDADGACNVKSQDKFVGNYIVNEDCSTAPYNVAVSAGSTITTINFSNFWDVFQKPVVATIEGNVVTIARQEPDSDKFFVEGSGTYDPTTKKITITYTVKDEDPAAPASKTCSAMFTRI